MTHTEPEPNVSASILQAQIAVQELTPTKERVGGTEHDNFQDQLRMEESRKAQESLPSRLEEAGRATRSLTTESSKLSEERLMLYY
jgi:hypothetical protein